jgi:hypothetical protein
MCIGDVYSPKMGYKPVFIIGNISRVTSCNTRKSVHSLLGGRKRRARVKKSVRRKSKLSKMKHSRK